MQGLPIPLFQQFGIRWAIRLLRVADEAIVSRSTIGGTRILGIMPGFVYGEE